jgi:hypothetical protein
VAVEDDLDQLEKGIRQLQIEWEKFFGKVEKKPPTDLKTRIEAIVRKYAYAELRNNTERFRYQGLAARYNTFNELWQKRLRAMEEGTPAGLHGAQLHHLPPPVAPPPVERPSAAAAAAARAASGPGEFRVKDPAADASAVKALFDQFQKARQATGEGAVKFESFQKIIAQQASRILTEKGAQAVDFRLETKDGKVSLKAKPVK